MKTTLHTMQAIGMWGGGRADPGNLKGVQWKRESVQPPTSPKWHLDPHPRSDFVWGGGGGGGGGGRNYAVTYMYTKGALVNTNFK